MPMDIPVQIRRLPGSLEAPGRVRVDLPAYQSPQAAGMDLHACVDGPVILEPGQVKLIPCGFAMALPEGYEAQVRPRSGLAAKHSIGIINSPGTIDSDYRGEVMVPLINHGRAAFTIERNMRIAQMLVKPIYRTVWIEVDELDSTQRGQGGFGHTGR